MRPNWFIALPLDGSFLASLPPPPRHFRLFHHADVHVTLAFLGACRETDALSGFAAVEADLLRKPVEPLAISLGKVAPLGPARAYSALSALLADGRAPAEACIARLRSVALDAARARRDERPPLAHVTLARPLRSADEAARREGLAWASSLYLGEVRARLARLALYTWSERRPSEPRFRIVAERGLGAPDRH